MLTRTYWLSMGAVLARRVPAVTAVVAGASTVKLFLDRTVSTLKVWVRSGRRLRAEFGEELGSDSGYGYELLAMLAVPVSVRPKGV